VGVGQYSADGRFKDHKLRASFRPRRSAAAGPARVRSVFSERLLLGNDRVGQRAAKVAVYAHA
jgi:hypothetical protein